MPAASRNNPVRASLPLRFSSGPTIANQRETTVRIVPSKADTKYHMPAPKAAAISHIRALLTLAYPLPFSRKISPIIIAYPSFIFNVKGVNTDALSYVFVLPSEMLCDILMLYIYIRCRFGSLNPINVWNRFSRTYGGSREQEISVFSAAAG